MTQSCFLRNSKSLYLMLDPAQNLLRALIPDTNPILHQTIGRINFDRIEALKYWFA